MPRPPRPLTDWRSALPFWMTLVNVPLAVLGTLWGGLWLLALRLLLVLRLQLLRGRWPWPLLPVGSGGKGVWRLGLGHWLAL
ncbi:MAG: hypothetical protein VXW43_11980 [Pseudomonadota bacterium]|nr:hypothetical protein [Pseudomonadota bacterium]